MTLFGIRLPMMSSLILWILVWELVGRMVLVRSISKRDLVGAMAWVTTPALIGPVMGPPVGGFITTYASWHWIFLINVPIGLGGIALATRYIEDMRAEQMALQQVPHSSESQVSRFTLSNDEGITEIRPNNSFLHDNVD